MNVFLIAVSLEDHSHNDCLLVTVMSHGEEDGRIHAADKEYSVQKLWEVFLGDECKSLTGKPKLFFIDTSRGDLNDPGVKLNNASDEVEDDSTENVYMIPKLADLLVMHSTTEGHSAFISLSSKLSWFLESLQAELKADSQDDFMRILTRLNNRVANINHTKDTEFYGTKQMPIIVSMLTKTLHFTPKRKKFQSHTNVQ